MMSLYQAAKSGDEQQLGKLLASGSPVDFVEGAPPCWTPMMVAAYEGHLTVVRQLLSAGAAIDAEDLDFFTAVALAAGKQNWDVVALLAEEGADFGVVAADGKTGFERVLRCRRKPIREKILSILKARLAGLPVVLESNGDTMQGISCGRCGRATVCCHYNWSGFGDSWDNFRHKCSNSECGDTRERTGIPGKFPKEAADDWSHCPFCGRSSRSAEEERA